jgi:hypothetical protein
LWQSFMIDVPFLHLENPDPLELGIPLSALTGLGFTRVQLERAVKAGRIQCVRDTLFIERMFRYQELELEDDEVERLQKEMQENRAKADASPPMQRVVMYSIMAREYTLQMAALMIGEKPERKA